MSASGEWTAVRAQVRVWGGKCPAVGNRRLTWRERHGVLLEVFDAEGHRGLGEASPLPGFSPDTLQQCHEALAAWCRSLPQTVNMAYLQKLPLVMPEPPAARFAVETALLDLQGRRDPVVPVTRLLCRELSHRVHVSRLLSGRRVDPLARQVRRGLEEGFWTFKLKVGGTASFAQDLRLVSQLREAVPGNWRLRLDANGSWSLGEAPGWLEKLAPWRIELVEDPVPAHELPDLGPGPIPVAADKALQEEKIRRRLLRSSSCRLWVLKPTVIGGFQRCREVQEQAGEHGIQCLFSHCFEGPVGLAAVRAVALCLGDARHAGAGAATAGGDLRALTREEVYAHGVDLHPALAAFPPLPVPGDGAACLEPVSEGGGLGVER